MKAEVYLVDENGKRMTNMPTLIEPVETIDNGIVTKHIFAFEFSELDKNAFDKITEVEK